MYNLEFFPFFIFLSFILRRKVRNIHRKKLALFGARFVLISAFRKNSYLCI